ncbi:ATP-binding protein [Streptomyces sp. NPDC095613]|uniref:sensor histidine kinase n=1 Tax=Streptomyces sp. NPDC095613 TaxID=3155540 RepID=UPI00332E2F4A
MPAFFSTPDVVPDTTDPFDGVDSPVLPERIAVGDRLQSLEGADGPDWNDVAMLRRRLQRLWQVPAVMTLTTAGAVWLGSASVRTTEMAWTAAGAGVASLVAVGAWSARRAAAVAAGIHRRRSDTESVLRQRLAQVTELAVSGKAEIAQIVSAGRQESRTKSPRRAVGTVCPAPEVDAFGYADADRAVHAMLQEALDAVHHGGGRSQVDVLVRIARRLQTLVKRSLDELTDLEKSVEDPVLLDGLFRLDHLVTRVRRQVESLAVLGGAVPRSVSEPVPLATVLRQAVAEIQQYPRVRVPVLPDGAVLGYAAVDIIHLLAELVENATVFSRPDTQVLVRAAEAPAGLAVEIEDRGLTIPGARLSELNRLLTAPERANVQQLLTVGQIGLYVVARIAARHSIHVELRTNVYGGTQAVVILPGKLLLSSPPPTEPSAHAARTDEPHASRPPRSASASPPHPVAPDPAPAWSRPGSAPDRQPESSRGPEHQQSQDTVDSTEGRPLLPRRSGVLGPVPGPYASRSLHERADAAPDLGLMARYNAGVRRGTQPADSDPAAS